MKAFNSHTKKVLIGLAGGLVVLIGLILIPYPGPGWLIVFSGLAILATEFERAQRLLDMARRRYDAWASWLKQQHWTLQGLVLLGTGLVVVVTVWLLNS